MELELPGLTLRLRPSFSALVAAEAEIGGLSAAIERAAEGDTRLADIAALVWHCAVDDVRRPGRATLESLLVRAGLARAMPAYRGLLMQIFAGN